MFPISQSHNNTFSRFPYVLAERFDGFRQRGNTQNLAQLLVRLETIYLDLSEKKNRDSGSSGKTSGKRTYCWSVLKNISRITYTL